MINLDEVRERVLVNLCARAWPNGAPKSVIIVLKSLPNKVEGRLLVHSEFGKVEIEAVAPFPRSTEDLASRFFDMFVQGLNRRFRPKPGETYGMTGFLGLPLGYGNLPADVQAAIDKYNPFHPKYKVDPSLWEWYGGEDEED